MKKPFWWRWVRWHSSKKYKASPAKHAEWALESVARTLTGSDIAIDCGANVGEYTALMAGRGAKVFAFEPDPTALKLLNERVGSLPNVEVKEQAVGVGNKKVMLYRAMKSDDDPIVLTQSSSVLPFKSNIDQSNFVEIDQIDFADFVEKLDRPVKLMKVDIEGAEFELLEALIDRGLIGRIEHIFVETHDHKIPELKSAAARVREKLAAARLTNVNLDWR
ncbi:FkbM family methyltransferase [Chthonobacter albigriseus]|uniref:FkbM family methyltransferase n=1 Tax=Chthonobacter albigriseus TaxID=1683161 RepID=UPI0015EE5661|nr:FkbM family methyltransferase [Chthonobacter albigriseus]